MLKHVYIPKKKFLVPMLPLCFKDLVERLLVAAAARSLRDRHFNACWSNLAVHNSENSACHPKEKGSQSETSF